MSGKIFIHPSGSSFSECCGLGPGMMTLNGIDVFDRNGNLTEAAKGDGWIETKTATKTDSQHPQ